MYTSIKVGNPPLDLSIILDDSDCGFVLKEDSCSFKSDYTLSSSKTLKYNLDLFYQYINNELKLVLNNTRDIIYLNQADIDYFNSSLKEQRNGKHLTKIKVDDFNFLYLPNNKEIEFIYKTKRESAKTLSEKDKKQNIAEKNGENVKYVNSYEELYKSNNDDNDEQNYYELFNQYYPRDEEEDDVDVFSPKCAYMGMLPKGINNGLTDSKINFIKQLKNKKIIDNYYWYIHYNKENSAELVIGAAPHEINPEKYPEEDLYMIHAKLINDLFFWEIEFNTAEIYDINSNKRYSLSNKNAVLSLNDNYIFCPKEYYKNIISIFFKPYLDSFKCKKEVVYKYDSKYTVIYCHRRNFTENDLKKFPILSLKSVDLNYIFNLDYKDLFYKTKNVYIFKIINEEGFNIWKFGKIFLEKYQFVFNYDSKMFGFYHKHESETSDNDKMKASD